MTPLDANTLADALDCFWNAAIGESHSRQEGAATAAIMASGMAAVATHLRETAKLADAPPQDFTPPQNLEGENALLRERMEELRKEYTEYADEVERRERGFARKIGDQEARAERAEEAFEIAVKERDMLAGALARIGNKAVVNSARASDGYSDIQNMAVHALNNVSAKHDGTQAELITLQQEHEKVLAALKEASVTLCPEPVHGVPGAWRYVAERRPTEWPRGTEIYVEHDGFRGRVLGPYVTFEGKRGQVCQQSGSRVVHVYGEKWLKRVTAIPETRLNNEGDMSGRMA